MAYIRPAGLNERRCIARDTLGLYGNIITVATYSKPHKGISNSVPQQQISTDDLVKVLKACICEHPVLSTAIRDAEGEKPLLASVARMDLRQHLRVIDDVKDDILQARDDAAKRTQLLLERVHNEPFTGFENVPPWRVYIVHLPRPTGEAEDSGRFLLAFAISHALVDGSSGLAFHSTFSKTIRQIGDIKYDSELEWDVPSSSHQILPALEHAAKMPISWSFLLRPALNEFLPSWITSALGMKDTMADDAWCGATRRPTRMNDTELIRTDVRTAFISQSTMHRALQVCKSRNARFTRLVAHLTAMNLAHALESRGHVYRKFLAEIAIDLRKCVPEATNHMANYVSATTISIIALPNGLTEPLNDDDWIAIQHTTAHLAERSTTLADQPTALLKYLTDIRAWVLKQAAKPASVSFGVSNLGVAKNLSDDSAEESGNWTVEDVTFSQSADGMGPPFNLNIASSADGPTALVITWWPGMLGVEDGESFAEEVLDGVLQQLDAIH